MPMEELLLAALRGGHLAALAGAAGVALVAALAGEGAAQARAGARICLGAALALGLVWFAVQAAAMTGASWPQAQIALLDTRFGQAMTARLALLSLALIAPWGGFALILAALLLQPWLGHGAAAPQAVTLANAAHVLAGALWAGGLPWLWLTLRRNPQAGLRAARRFSPWGVGLVLVLGAGIWGVWPLIGGVPGIFGTDYGRALLIKSSLLLVMLACAGVNGVWLAPSGWSRGLRISLAVEALAGLLVIFVAAWLALQPPGLHDRVIWPFTRRLAPGLWEDAFLRDRLLRMALPVAAACGLLVAAFAASRRARWAALALVLTAGAALSRTPVFPAAPFLRPSSPTSFQSAETRRDVVSIQRGAGLYVEFCASCHGEGARGAGPAATGDPVWPPDLTAPWFLQTGDGDWFWRIRHGMTVKTGAASMPGFPALTDAEIWRLVDFLRAQASARSLDRRGRWGIPPAAPALRLRCAGEPRAFDLSRPPEGAEFYWGRGEPPSGILRLDPERCGPLGSDMRASLALLSGEQVAEATEFLIDRDGYLRWISPQTPEAEALAAVVNWLRANPAAALGVHH